ncbi:hypothetical protein [Nocardia sp. NPDC050718]|uniref:hypothetical protein n=1 Tax=Nocardia sp. NPDC050718 TaxID=3155788 RepID=UPI0033CA020D
MPHDGRLATGEQVIAYLRWVLNTPGDFLVWETPTHWICQDKPHPPDERTVWQGDGTTPPDPGGGYKVYGIEKKNAHVHLIGQNPPDHPVHLLDRANWENTFFRVGQIHPKPWQVGINLVRDTGRILTIRTRCISRTDPPQPPIDQRVTIDKVTGKIDYGIVPAPRVLIQAVTKVRHSLSDGEPWPVATTFEI